MEKEWIPTLEEYNPGITKEQWIKLVQDRNVFTENALITFACIQKAKIATCADMVEEFGRGVGFYNTNNWQTGKRVYEKTNCPLSERDEGGNRFWSVCCLGRPAEKNRWEFQIRPELQDAFNETGVLEGVEVMAKQGETTMSEDLITKYTELLKNSRNLILTGAPGTGKTYLAHQIAERMGCEKDNIGFVQFHPSYDYTDFVEGLRPKQKDNSDDIGFERKDGVFKDFCARALKNLTEPFVFIIDEINRGEVAKIFGELFFSVDPGYRITGQDLDAAKAGTKTITTIKTQYANLESDGNDFDRALGTKDYGHFFIPENVYIIGTMNDILTRQFLPFPS